MIAFLALQIALGSGRGTASAQGAFTLIAQEPLGAALLVLVALGLAAFALDRFLVATILAEPDDNKLKRAAIFGTGVAYLALGVVAAMTATGGGKGGGGGPRRPTAALLSLPFGTWLVGAIGVGLVVFALSEFRHAAGKDATKKLRLGHLSAGARRVVQVVESLGIAGHGVAFALIGYFVLQAAMTHNAKKAESLDGALLRLAGEPYGTALITVTALGLLLYGMHCLIQARWRRLSS